MCTSPTHSQPGMADGPSSGSVGTWASPKACTYADTENVICEAGHFVVLHSGVDEEHAGPPLHHNGVVLAEHALVDRHSLRDLPQHGAPSAYGPQLLVETVVPAGSGCKQYGRRVWAAVEAKNELTTKPAYYF